MEDRRFPLLAVGGAVGIAVLFIVLFALRGGSDTKAASGSTTADDTGAPIERPAIPTQTTTPTTFAPAPPAGPDPTLAAADLDRQLKKQRLWGTVQVIGDRADVRSGACDDPGMRPVLDGAAASLKSAGLTKLRCLAQSGAVVFERDL